MQRFVMEVVDSQNLCILEEESFEGQAETLLSAIGITEIDMNQSHNWVVDLDEGDINQVKALFNVSLVVGDGRTARIRPWHWLDQLPYKIHTNREFIMMMQKTKPLAVFQVQDSLEPNFDVFPESLFDKLVYEKVFVKHEEKIINYVGDKKITMRMVLYCLNEENWRIKAFLLLHNVAKKIKWNDGFERMEGMLLGYTEQECDIYLDILSKMPKQKLW